MDWYTAVHCNRCGLTPLQHLAVDQRGAVERAYLSSQTPSEDTLHDSDVALCRIAVGREHAKRRRVVLL